MPDQSSEQFSVSGERSVGVDVMQGGSVHTGDNYFHGVPQPLPEPVGQIRNFLDAYLGSPDYPVPFGGRGPELKALDAWLADLSAEPYLLLTAPAGRGKSALLAHWVELLTEAAHPLLDVVYHPISVRYETNGEGAVFASLAAQLERLRGKDEEIRSSFGSSPEHWRNLVAEYLRTHAPERQLLLVLDALDEAAGWEPGPGLFPRHPPPGLRIVVSARLTARAHTSENWLSSLDWQRAGLVRSMELAGLNRSGVEEALRSMGAPLDTVATRIDVVNQILRLSGGDPLLVGLYADSLGGKGEAALHLQPEALESLRPGLHGFFARWWKDQERLWGKKVAKRRKTVRPLLNLLACAMGPLGTNDLVWLARDDSKLDAGSLKEVLRVLGRFVVGNGSGTGYVFAHHRLAEYFWDEESEEGLPQSEQKKVESRFLRYGEYVLAEMNNGRMAPEQAPAYVIRHYGAHLVRGVAPKTSGAHLQAWEALVSEGWWRAWLHLEGGYGGFLGDVNRARQAVQAWNQEAVAQEKPARYLGLEVLCALCDARIAAQSGNLVPELVAALVNRGVWTLTEARAHIRPTRNPVQLGKLLVLLLEQAPEGARPQLAEEALHVTQWIRDERQRAQVLGALGPHLSEAALAQALQNAEQIRDEGWRAHVLASLAPRLPEVRALALQTARDIRDEKWKAQILTSLASHLPEVLLAQALETVQQMRKEKQRAHALAALVPYLSEALLSQALQAARQIGDEEGKAEALASLASRLPEKLRAEVLAQALHAARQIEEAWRRAPALASLAPHLPEELGAEAIAEALRLARHTRGEGERARIQVSLAPCLPDALLAQAFHTAEQIGDEWWRAQVLAALTPRLPEAIAPAFQAAQQIQSEWQRARVLGSLAPHLPESLLAQALQTAQQMTDERPRAQILAALAPRLPKALLTQALQTAQQITDGDGRAEIVVSLAPYLPETLLAQTLQTTRQIGDESWRAQVLTSLVPGLPENVGSEVLAQALQATRQIENEEWRVHVLASLTPSLPEALLDQALETARQIENESWRARVLTLFAPRLPKELLTQALRAAQQIEEKSSRAQRVRILALLAPRVPEALLAEALHATQQMRDESWKGQALALLAPRLPEALLAQALHAAQQIGDEWGRGEVLVSLAPRLPEALLAQAFQTALQIQNEWRKAPVLAALAPHLPEALLPEAFHITQQIQNEGWRAEVLALLAPRLPEALLTEALEIARQLGGAWPRATVLAALSPRLVEEQRKDIIAAEKCCAVYGTPAVDASLASIVEQLPPALAYSFWSSVLNSVSPSLHGSVLRLTAGIHVFGGEEADASALANALLVASEWWP